jgi:UDP-N-acetylmuramoylalanine--D-glutamate ligase
MNLDSGTYRGKTVLVVGAARSGIAAAEFLLARGARVVLTDRKSAEELGDALAPLHRLPPGSGELVLELGGHRPESFSQCDFAVISPGVPLSHPMFDESRRAGIQVMAEVELAARHLHGKILGITGSNGKTTTTTLVAELLRGSGLRSYAAGNIGTPLISLAAASTPEDVYAVELSSFQLESIHEFRPFAATILNLTPDHMDRYMDFEAYIGAKKRIFMNQKAADFAVLNQDDPRTAALGAHVPSAPVFFSRQRALERGTFVMNGRLTYRDSTGNRFVRCRRDSAPWRAQSRERARILHAGVAGRRRPREPGRRHPLVPWRRTPARVCR